LLDSVEGFGEIDDPVPARLRTPSGARGLYAAPVVHQKQIGMELDG
jgi:hypothetical protein